MTSTCPDGYKAIKTRDFTDQFREYYSTYGTYKWEVYVCIRSDGVLNDAFGGTYALNGEHQSECFLKNPYTGACNCPNTPSGLPGNYQAIEMDYFESNYRYYCAANDGCAQKTYVCFNNALVNSSRFGGFIFKYSDDTTYYSTTGGGNCRAGFEPFVYDEFIEPFGNTPGHGYFSHGGQYGRRIIGCVNKNN
jgi:hypothetical protein